MVQTPISKARYSLFRLSIKILRFLFQPVLGSISKIQVSLHKVSDQKRVLAWKGMDFEKPGAIFPIRHFCGTFSGRAKQKLSFCIIPIPLVPMAQVSVKLSRNAWEIGAWLMPVATRQHAA
jgi:hypothetical protein